MGRRSAALADRVGLSAAGTAVDADEALIAGLATLFARRDLGLTRSLVAAELAGRPRLARCTLRSAGIRECRCSNNENRRRYRTEQTVLQNAHSNSLPV